MEAQTLTFAASRFVPVAVGFFGLGTGYFVWGGQALFGFPKASPEVNRVRALNLKPHTRYYYTVDSEDASGSSDGVNSPVKTFTTQ